MTERKLTMSRAIVEAIDQEMARDPKVFVMGEDVGAYGGIFGSTTGLLQKYGEARVRDTPISETAFIGAATGAAAEGMRPIVELMFVDFFGVCMDQIYNHLAKNTYMSGGALRLPVVLTTAYGGGYNDAAQHSQTLYGVFAHVPGLKVVVPSNAYDAKGLMTQAIRDDDPVMYFFHKGLMGLGWMTSPATAAAVGTRPISPTPFRSIRNTPRPILTEASPMGCTASLTMPSPTLPRQSISTPIRPRPITIAGLFLAERDNTTKRSPTSRRFCALIRKTSTRSSNAPMLTIRRPIERQP